MLQYKSVVFNDRIYKVVEVHKLIHLVHFKTFFSLNCESSADSNVYIRNADLFIQAPGLATEKTKVKK